MQLMNRTRGPAWRLPCFPSRFDFMTAIIARAALNEKDARHRAGQPDNGSSASPTGTIQRLQLSKTRKPHQKCINTYRPQQYQKYMHDKGSLEHSSLRI